MGVDAYVIAPLLENKLGLRKGGLLAILIAGCIYAAFLFLFRVVTIDELKNIRKRG